MLDLAHNVFMGIALLKHGSIYEKSILKILPYSKSAGYLLSSECVQFKKHLILKTGKLKI